MTNEDIHKLMLFITRIGMFIFENNKDNITSFMNGYEFGSGSQIIETIKSYLQNKKKIDYKNTGWVGQIEKYAVKLNKNWEATFREVMLDILFSNDIKKDTIDVYKTRICGLLENAYTQKFWKEDWLQLCLIKKRWFKKLWNKDEFLKIKEITEFYLKV